MTQTDPGAGAIEGSVPVPLSVPYRFHPAAGPGPSPLLVCLHRYGGDPAHFTQIIPRLALPGFAFLLPGGPFRVPSGKGEIGRAWAVSTRETPDPAGREASLAAVEAAVREVLGAHPLRKDAVLLLGHSQGGYLAVHLLLRLPDLFRAAVSLGGTVNAELARRDGARAAGKPALLSHGEADEIVPIARAEEAEATLLALGAKPELRRYPDVGHWPTREMYADAGRWIEQQLRMKNEE